MQVNILFAKFDNESNYGLPIVIIEHHHTLRFQRKTSKKA